MKITGMRAVPVAVPMLLDESDTYMHTGPAMMQAVTLEVFTDEGITGIAEVPVVYGATMSQQLVMSAEKFVVGRDPADVNILLKELYCYYNLNHLNSHAANWAVNSIERACWDILGQKAGLPLYKLWGGAFRNEIEFFGFIESENLDEIKRVAKERAAKGYKVLYTKCGFSTPEFDVEMVKAIREAVPDPSVKIRVDFNQAWTVGEAISIINKMEPYGMDCADQPVMMYDVDGLKAVRNATNVPIAAHEATWTMYDMLRVIKAGAADAVHIDPRFDCGYHGARVSAGICEAAGIPVICHAYYELGVALTERMQIIASCPAFTMVHQTCEYDYLSDDIIKGGKYDIVDGKLALPTKPGLGVELDQDKVAKYNEVYIKQVKEAGYENGSESPLYGAQFTRRYLKNLYTK